MTHARCARLVTIFCLTLIGAAPLWAQPVPAALTLDEARVIVDAAKAIVKADNGRAGHRGDGDVRAVKAGIAAWEKFRQSKRQ